MAINNKPSIYVTRLLAEPAMQRLHAYFDVECNPDDRILDQSEIIEQVQGRDALLCLLTDTIDAAVMDAEPRLRVISNHAVGYNNIDVAAANERKLPVCITPGVLTETSADITWGLILAVARRMVESDKFARAGKWNGWGPLQFLGTDVHGKTLGIVGMGRIGAAVARRAKGFNMHVIYTARTSKPEIESEVGAVKVELDQLLGAADFVSLHVPLSSETTHLIGAKELCQMRPGAYLINTARGPIIDEAALVHALTEGHIAGAGLDVYEEEPTIHPELLNLNNTVLLPHIASASLETRTKMAMLAVENAIMIFEGERPHAIVNPEVLQS